MSKYIAPDWLKELKRREANGDSAIREKLTQAIMYNTGWPRGTVQLMLQGYNLRSKEIDKAAEQCLGMDSGEQE